MYNLKTQMMKKATYLMVLLGFMYMKPTAYAQTETPTVQETFQKISYGEKSTKSVYNKGNITDNEGRSWEFTGALVTTALPKNDNRSMAPRLVGPNTGEGNKWGNKGGYIKTNFTLKGLSRITVQFISHNYPEKDLGPTFTLSIYTSLDNGKTWVKQGDKTLNKGDKESLIDLSPKIPAKENVMVKMVNESTYLETNRGNRINILKVVMYEGS